MTRKPKPDGTRWRAMPLALLVLSSTFALADGIVVDKIYDPYVQPLEKEFEIRALVFSDDDLVDTQKHSFGFGQSLGERWFGEIYAIGVKTTGEHFRIDTYELEFKRQLTEQGEYAVDWGLLFEVEREADINVWEVSTSLIASREIGQWVATANFDLIYEWGDSVTNEFETALHTQFRRRWSERFEPGLEIHVGQDTLAVGPVFSGLKRLGGGSKFAWELGYFAGLDEITPDDTVRLTLEYEFY